MRRVTLTQYLVGRQQKDLINADLRLLLETIARAVLAMAHSLRMDVTAEGVETAAQLEFLRREGCLAYQGYYCSPPVAEEQLLALLETMSTQRRRVRAIESVGR